MSAAEPASPPHQPWWIPRFLGRVPAGVSDSQVSLVGIIALALVFEHYDLSMISAAAPHIRASFGVAQSDLGQLLAWVTLGAIPAVFVVPFADRIGRRRLFLATVVGMSLATFATAFSQRIEHFVIAQMLARTCFIAGSAVAFVIVSEELPARHRGWAVGILGALGSVGVGLGALIFALVDYLPYGWRALYVFGAFPLLLLPRFRRRVPETRRFTQSAGAGPAAQRALGWWRPFLTLVREHPGRLGVIALVGVLAAAAHGPAFGLLGDYVQHDHGWSEGQYSAMVVIGGGIGILGNVVAGNAADRIGRRWVGLAVLGVFPFVAAAFYRGSGLGLALLWIGLVFAATGGNTIVRAFTAELFPTAARGTASGSLTLFETLGRAGGLAVVSALTPAGQPIAPVTSLIVFASLAAGLVILTLPETAGRELEEIAADAPERGGEAEPG